MSFVKIGWEQSCWVFSLSMDRVKICKFTPISTLQFAIYVKEVVAKVNFKDWLSLEISFSDFFVSILPFALLLDLHSKPVFFSHQIIS